MTDPNPNRPRLSRKTRIAFACVALGVGFAMSVVLAEVVLRLFFPQPLAGVMFDDNAEMGFWNRANLHGKPFQSEPNRPFYRITTDRNGYRGVRPVETAKPQGVRRIVVVGDSFVFGVGVEDSETIPAQLESILNASAPKGVRYEAINAGCPGWGTENILAFWRTRGAKLAPDLLVATFFHNDLYDNLRQTVYRIENGRAIYDPKPSLSRAKRIVRMIPFYTFLSEHSHLANLLRRTAVRLWMQPEKTAPAPATTTSASATTDTQTVDPLLGRADTVEILMRTLGEETHRAAVPLVFALLPGENDVNQTTPKEFGEVLRRAEQLQGEGALEALSLMPSVEKAWKIRPGEIYQPSDGHYTAEGNRIVAEAIAARVRQIIEPQEKSAP
jgi:lysophospholipase L1-like esterase